MMSDDERTATWLLTYLDHTMDGWDGDEDTLDALGLSREWVLSQLVKNRDAGKYLTSQQSLL